MKTIPVKIRLPIPNTRQEWELYDMPGADSAVQSLTSALTNAINAMTEHKMSAAEAFDRYWYPSANHYAKFGACDSEPKDTARDVLERVAALMKQPSYLPEDRK